MGMGVTTTLPVEGTVTITMTVSEADRVAERLTNCSDYTVGQDGAVQSLRMALRRGAQEARSRA